MAIRNSEFSALWEIYYVYNGRRTSVYLAVLKEYEKNHDYKKMKEIGIEALNKIECDLKIRGEIAIKTAQASRCVNDIATMRKCWYEAFYFNSTIPNFLRLFVDQEVVNRYKALAEKRIEALHISEYHNNQKISEASENEINELEYKFLYFFSGHFDRVYNWCKEQKQPLGWSGNFIGHDIRLMLLYLYADSNPRKALINQYMRKYPRHRSFRGALNEYMN